MERDIERHRLSALTDGLLIGVGLILILWALSSIATLYSGSPLLPVGQILVGVIMFAVGGFREAYVWGMFSSHSEVPQDTHRGYSKVPGTARSSRLNTQTKNHAQATRRPGSYSGVTTEQIRDYSITPRIRETEANQREST